MAITTNSELKVAIANFANRTDLTARIPEFVTLAEARIFYGSQEAPFVSDPLRVRAMETSTSLTVNAQSVALPTRFLQARRCYISGDTGGPVQVISPDEFWRQYTVTNSGVPRQMTLEGENVLFGPTPDSSYTGKLLYYQRFAALSSDSDTNWLLTEAPGAYLQGALIELFDYLKDFDAKANAQKAFAGIINALNQADKADRFSGSPWVGQSGKYNP